MLNWQWFLSDILGENSIKKRRSNSFQKAFERRLCFDRMAGVTGIFERISFLLQKSLFVFHGHRFSFCGIYSGIPVCHYQLIPVYFCPPTEAFCFMRFCSSISCMFSFAFVRKSFTKVFSLKDKGAVLMISSICGVITG